MNRGGLQESASDAIARADDLQFRNDKLLKQHEEHLNEIRIQRDALAEELSELKSWMGTIITALDRDVPSILEQTKWKAGFFDFGKASVGGTRFYNCGLATRTDGDWLLTRRSIPWARFPFGMNDLMAFKLDGKKPLYGVKIPIPKRYADEHFEDPRISLINGKHWIGCTTFQVQPNKKWTGSHQVVFNVNDLWHPNKVYDPIYGVNGGSTYMNTGNEKNWLWFEHEGRMMLVYMTDPHQVVEFNGFLEAVKTHETVDGNPLWQHGHKRGGTPPIRIGDEYFSFFHSSTPWIGDKRRYHMGAYAFEAKPPFRVTRMTTLPLLSGSKSDPWVEGLPLVVFPCGALFRDEKWLVTMGINDYVSAWIEIPHVDLLSLLRESQPIKHEPESIQKET